MNTYIITIVSDQCKEAIILNATTNQEIKVPIITVKQTLDTQIMFSDKDFSGQELMAVELFEKELEITDEQRIKLYYSWGLAKAIMIKDVAEKLDIPRDEAIFIISLANKHGLITRGNNNTWKVIEQVVKNRWSHEAVRLSKLSKLPYKPRTIQESLDRLKNQPGYTEEDTLRARGEVGVGMGEDSTMTVVTSKAMPKKKEKSVEVVNADGVDDSKWYSGVDKDKQRKEAEERNRIEAAKALEEMNRGSGVPQKRQTAVEIDPITRKPIKKESQVKVVEGVKGMSSGYIQKDSKGIPSKKKPSTSKGVRRT